MGATNGVFRRLQRGSTSDRRHVISNCKLVIANCEMKGVGCEAFFNEQLEIRNDQFAILPLSET